MSDEKTNVERFSEAVMTSPEAHQIIQLVTDFCILEGDWTVKHADQKNPIYAQAKREWETVRRSITSDVDEHGYDITKWSGTTISAFTITILAMPKITEIVKNITLAYAQATIADDRMDTIKDMIRNIITGGRE
jgi:hypothetical protein